MYIVLLLLYLQSKKDKMNTRRKVKRLTNKNIIQSYLLTVAKYDTNIYAKRILTYVVAANQDYIEGKRVGGNVINIEEDLFKEREYTVQIKDILLGDEDKNYTRVIKAFQSLQNKLIAFDDEDNNYISVPFLTALIVRRKQGVATFRMSELVYKAFSDYTRGYRKYEFEMSLSFTSVYSMRLYELFSNQEKPITYTIDSLKDMFQIADKYKETKDFIRRVIEPAKKELDEKSPYSFTYRMNKTGKRFTSITFTPVRHAENVNEEIERKELRKQTSLRWDLDKSVIDYLKTAMGFTADEIKRNRDVFKEAQIMLKDILLVLSELSAKSRTKSNPKGWIIQSLRCKVDDEKRQMQLPF